MTSSSFTLSILGTYRCRYQYWRFLRHKKSLRDEKLSTADHQQFIDILTTFAEKTSKKRISKRDQNLTVFYTDHRNVFFECCLQPCPSNLYLARFLGESGQYISSGVRVEALDV